MDSSEGEIAHDFPPYFKVYKDGRVERYRSFPRVGAGLDSTTGVQSKDVMISPETGVKARIFLPKMNSPGQKLPLLVHYHGGAFCLGSAFGVMFNTFLTSLVSQANIIAISVDYSLAPEHPLPIAYDDSCAGLKWVAAHSNGLGPEPWLNEHADLRRVFLAGESAGANIAHYLAVQAGAIKLDSIKIDGLLIVHPFFGVKEPHELYKYMCPGSSGSDDDPKLNPAADPNLKNLAGDRVLVCVAEKDGLRNRGVAYYETLAESEWGGNVEFYETSGEGHCFHLFTPDSEKVGPFTEKMVHFISNG